MIIDWSNVAVGDPLADVMNTWMLMVTSSPDSVPLVLRPVLRRIRRSLNDGFIEGTTIDDDAVGGSGPYAISDSSNPTLVTTRR